MPAKKPRISNTRDLGLSGVGKGDAPRTIFNAAWRTRFDLIKWDQCPECRGTMEFRGVDTRYACTLCQGTGRVKINFERDGHRLVKRYK